MQGIAGRWPDGPLLMKPARRTIFHAEQADLSQKKRAPPLAMCGAEPGSDSSSSTARPRLPCAAYQGHVVTVSHGGAVGMGAMGGTWHTAGLVLSHSVVVLQPKPSCDFVCACAVTTPRATRRNISAWSIKSTDSRYKPANPALGALFHRAGEPWVGSIILCYSTVLYLPTYTIILERVGIVLDAVCSP